MLNHLVLLVALALATSLTPLASAQHGRPAVRPDPVRTGPSQWVKRLISGINEGTGVEAWTKKSVMHMRLQWSDAPKEVEDGRNKEAKAEIKPVDALMMYDLRGRKMRIDFEAGNSFLVTRDEVSVWQRDSDAARLSREDVSDEALHFVRAAFYLVTLPLWLNDGDSLLGPGRLRELDDKLLFSSVLVVPPPVLVQERPPEENDEGPRPVSRPDDWYAYYTVTAEPIRIVAVAYLSHDRSRPDAAKSAEPRIVHFDDFDEVEGVALPRDWRFHEFNRETGTGARIGEARVNEIEFVSRDDSTFTAPEGALLLR